MVIKYSKEPEILIYCRRSKNEKMQINLRTAFLTTCSEFYMENATGFTIKNDFTKEEIKLICWRSQVVERVKLDLLKFCSAYP